MQSSTAEVIQCNKTIFDISQLLLYTVNKHVVTANMKIKLINLW